MITRPKLNLKQAYERVKSKLTGALADIAALWPIAKNSAGNGIYNGKMTISQRGDYTSPTVVTDGNYYLDRWQVDIGTVTGTVQYLDTSQPNGQTGQSTRYAATSTATGYIGAFQPIEQYAILADKTVTFSAWVKSNHSSAALSTWDGAVGTTAHHTGGGEWELLSVTATISSSASSLWCIVRIDSSSITSGDYIEFTDVRLDLGSHRLSGDREHGEEKRLCRGYWYQPDLSGGSYSRVEAGFAISTTQARIVVKHKFHAEPNTISLSAAADFALADGVSSIAATAISIDNNSTSDITVLLVTVASGLTQFRPYTLNNNAKSTSTIGWGREL